MNSRKFGSAVLATVSVADEHLDLFTRVANALNKQNQDRASKMATLLEGALDNLENVVEQARSKTLAERYEAYPAELKAKLTLESGRLYFTVQGTALKSKDWPTRLKSGHKLSTCAADVLSKHDYDNKHRLVVEQKYKLGLVLGTEITEDRNRSTLALHELGRKNVGEQAVIGLKAEFALLIRGKFTNAELEIMGLWYIAVLHEPIVDSVGIPSVLYSSRSGGSYVYAYYVNPGSHWHGDGAFAFLAS